MTIVDDEIAAYKATQDFAESLQGFASFCETCMREGFMGPEDIGTIRDKLRDCAFVVSQFEKQRDELRASISALTALEARANELEAEREKLVKAIGGDVLPDGHRPGTETLITLAESLKLGTKETTALINRMQDREATLEARAEAAERERAETAAGLVHAKAEWKRYKDFWQIQCNEREKAERERDEARAEVEFEKLNAKNARWQENDAIEQNKKWQARVASLESRLPAAIDARAIAWMMPEHVAAYRSSGPKGIAWAHYEKNDAYTVALFTEPPADASTVAENATGQPPIDARALATEIIRECRVGRWDGKVGRVEQIIRKAAEAVEARDQGILLDAWALVQEVSLELKTPGWRAPHSTVENLCDMVRKFANNWRIPAAAPDTERKLAEAEHQLEQATIANKAFEELCKEEHARADVAECKLARAVEALQKIGAASSAFAPHLAEAALAALSAIGTAPAEADTTDIIERAAKLVEGTVVQERYRTWAHWDGGNIHREDFWVQHCDALAAQIRALKGAPAGAEGESDEAPWLNGRPYYCALCGAGGGEYLSCARPACKLETVEQAEARKAAATAPRQAQRPKPEPADGWIQWIGGPCPVEPGTLVDVGRRNGSIVERADASIFNWRGYGPTSPLNIIAYHVCPMPEQGEQQ